jgi:D-tyrosyl-tRNA(Tyr) deacylase
MRVVLQRVREASITRPTATITQGYLLLVAFTHTDTPAHTTWMADKIATLRLFSDPEGKMNLSLADVGGALLVVSQFTLYGDAQKGRRPSFIAAARPETAIPLYEAFIANLRATGLPIQTGEFGADMQIALVNDGPVTLVLDR